MAWMRQTVVIFLLTSLLAACTQDGSNAAADAAPPRGQRGSRHVLVVVMDGLRRDSITPEQMPALHALARSGVFFDAHHSVYPSSTQVNGAALATGQRPITSGIIANREYRPDLELLRSIDTNDEYFAWKADQGGDRFVNTATLPELARSQGLTTAVAGTKNVIVLWDRSFTGRTVEQPTVYEGKAIPSATLDPIIARQGPIPTAPNQKHVVNTARDTWTTRALTEQLWAKGVPDLSVLWLYEPDFSQHGVGVGAKNAKLALKSSDDLLAKVLKEMEKHGVREQTDVVVVSDHGFSTISRVVDVPKVLREAGFKAEGAYPKPPGKGQILVTGLGGSVSFYIGGKDEETRQKLLTFLQRSSWCGVIFTRDGAEGTFKLSEASLDTPDAPDVMVSMRWSDEISQHGTPGTVICDGMEKGQGMHVSLSRYDMANTLVAAGPSFRRGMVSKLPSGNGDVAPTLAHILGLNTDRPMDGRVLVEALTYFQGESSDSLPQTQTIRADRKVGDRNWKQYLQVTRYAGRTYIDEGNGTSERPATQPVARPAR